MRCKSFSQKSTELTFDQYIDSVNKLEDDSLYLDAKRLTLNYINSFEKNWFTVSKELIYINEKLSEYEENINIFSEGHEKGFFYLIHPRLPKFKPYLTLHNFDAIATNDQRLRTKANNRSETLFEVDLPENYSEKKEYPIILIFHGGGSNLKKAKQHWNAPILDTGFIKVYLQSYIHYDSRTFGWRSGDSKNDSAVLHIFQEILLNNNVDRNRIMVAGISAGGTYASDMALRQIIPVSGVITFCQGIPAFVTSDSTTILTNVNTIHYLVGGENDFYLPRQKQLTTIFDSNNILYKYVIENSMGHQYPENENYYILEGVNYIFTN